MPTFVSSESHITYTTFLTGLSTLQAEEDRTHLCSQGKGFLSSGHSSYPTCAEGERLRTSLAVYHMSILIYTHGTLSTSFTRNGIVEIAIVTRCLPLQIKETRAWKYLLYESVTLERACWASNWIRWLGARHQMYMKRNITLFLEAVIESFSANYASLGLIKFRYL